MNPNLSAYLSARYIDRQKGHRARVLNAFEQHRRHDFLSRELIEGRRDEALAKLLNHARESVPFYRERLKNAPAIEAKNAREILATLPVVRRADIQGAPDQFICPQIAAVDDATGGSTGTPLTFKVDVATQQAREASLFWADSLTGWRYGERIAMLWGSDRDVTISLGSLRLAVRWWLENRRWYNAFKMGEAEMRAVHEKLIRFQPHLIVAYANTAYEFCRWLEREGLTARYPLTAIVSSAEMLLPKARETIERVMKRPVFDRYGNREAGAIAAECTAHSGLHVNEMDFLIEVDSQDSRRQAGPLLLTYLHNYAMPLIRYDTGDLARWSTPTACACGRTTVRLAAVTGRQADIIRTKGGRWIHGEFFTHLLYGAPGVREFQFVQDTLDSYRLLIAGDRAVSSAHEEDWKARIRAEVGQTAQVGIEYVESIPVTASGKRRFTLTHLPPV